MFKKKVIVIGCHVTGYQIIRALDLKGIPVVALSYEKYDFAQYSTYVVEKAKIPHPRLQEKEFVNFLLSNSNRWGGSLIIDTDDHVAVCLSKNKSLLGKYYKLVTEKWDILGKFIKKNETYLLAEKCDIPYPRIYLPHDPLDLQKISGQIAFPCIIKPVEGHVFKWKFQTKVIEVRDRENLLFNYKKCCDSGYKGIIQEIIPGPDSNIFKVLGYVNSKGKLVSTFFYQKLRQNPPQFGVMRVGISIKPNKIIEELSTRLIEYTNYKGIFNLEFKWDPRDGLFKLIEMNIRANRTNWLATYCGLNFPWIIYMDLIENVQFESCTYKEDQYWIELYSDVLNSIFRNRKENFKFFEYIKPYISPNKTFAVLTWKDPFPFLKYSVNFPIKLLNEKLKTIKI